MIFFNVHSHMTTTSQIEVHDVKHFKALRNKKMTLLDYIFTIYN
jgi:hypothetical protein